MGEKQNEEQETEILDFTKPDYSFIPKGVHEWKQQGYYLVCKSCELEHAVWIGSEKIMIGIEERGKPILKRRG
uniref:Uncharacterized protein n=1 Tax=viral metagenome TaxID=1070528 RepID=A0A6M3J2Z3_9ZZZZ